LFFHFKFFVTVCLKTTGSGPEDFRNRQVQFSLHLLHAAG
jgi:hypothetical protein